MNDNCKCIKISTEGYITETTEKEADKETKGRTQSCYGLSAPQRWKHDRTFILSVVMNDMFLDSDPANVVATLLWSFLRSGQYDPSTTIYGDFYIYNETVEQIIDFPMEDFKYIISKLPELLHQTLLRRIR